MILNIQNKKPIISFGLGLTLLSCEVGDPVTIYQQEVYNDEYILIDNDINEVITIEWRTFASPTLLYADFNIVGTYNGRNVFFNDTDFFIGVGVTADVYIFWDGTKWLLVDDFVIGIGSYNEQIGWLNINNLRPVGTWQYIEYIFIPLTTASNLNNYTFTFPAVASKEIQIEMRSKSGLILTSNKINLIVT